MDNVVAALTHKRVLGVAIPIVISNATVPILGAVDTAVVGQMGLAAPIGAVGVGAIIISSIYWIFGFLRMGTTGLVAQSLGQEDAAETAALMTRALLIAAAGGLLLIALQVPLFWGAMQLAPASAEVENLAKSYIQIRIFSAPAAIAIFGITGWLVAHERTKTMLVIQLWMNGLNIVLDMVFVLQFGWGVQGVAFATFLAEWSGLGLALWLTRDAFANRLWRNWAHVFDRVKLMRMATVNGDIMMRSVLLQAAFLSFLFLGARFGDVTLAANQVLIQFLHVTAYALDGFAFAAEALVGQALGQRNKTAFRRAVYLSSFWGVVTVVVLSAAFAIFGTQLIAIMTTALDVRIEAARYLPWMIVGPLLGVACWMLDGVFIGATRTKDMRNMMIVSVGFYVVFILALLGPYENHGLWASLIFFFVIRGITLAWKYPALEASVGGPIK